MLSGDLRAIFVDHCTDSASEVVEVSNTSMAHSLTTGMPLLHMCLICMRLHTYDL